MIKEYTDMVFVDSYGPLAVIFKNHVIHQFRR